VFVMTPPDEHTSEGREGETIEGSRTMRNRPYPVLKCSNDAGELCCSGLYRALCDREPHPATW